MDCLQENFFETPVHLFSGFAPRSRKVVETPIQCSTTAFYKFFKKQANFLPNVCGSIVQTIGLVDSNKSWVNTVGSRKVIEILSAESCRGTYEIN
jgi:hypothetical protein